MYTPTVATKLCARCGPLVGPKKVTEFGWRDGSHRARHSYCRECRRSYDRKHLSENPDLYRARNRRARHRMTAWVATLKVGPCTDCKKSYPPCVMDFDHKSGKKVANISAMALQCLSKETILREIAKCDLVCANCHRLRTCKRSHAHNA